MPAVSCPREASFSVWTSRSWVVAQLLERRGELARARLHLVEQADVLDGDHGLFREGLDERDLLVGEGLGFELDRS